MWGVNFSFKVFFFNLLTTFFLCSADCDTMNAFEERRSLSVRCLCPYSSNYCASETAVDTFALRHVETTLCSNYERAPAFTKPLTDSQSHDPFFPALLNHTLEGNSSPKTV